jgi:hypothetical protein
MLYPSGSIAIWGRGAKLGKTLKSSSLDADKGPVKRFAGKWPVVFAKHFSFCKMASPSKIR